MEANRFPEGLAHGAFQAPRTPAARAAKWETSQLSCGISLFLADSERPARDRTTPQQRRLLYFLCICSTMVILIYYLCICTTMVILINDHSLILNALTHLITLLLYSGHPCVRTARSRCVRAAQCEVVFVCLCFRAGLLNSADFPGAWEKANQSGNESKPARMR